MEFHKKEFNKVCRGCGQRQKKAKRSREMIYECIVYVKELAEVFQLTLAVTMRKFPLSSSVILACLP